MKTSKIIFVIWLSLVSGSSWAQNGKKTISQVSERIVNTVLSDTVFGKSGTLNAKWTVGAEPVSGDISGTQGNVFVHSLRGTALSSTSPTTGQVFRFNGTNWVPTTLSKSMISDLTNVDNTTDLNKPVSTATTSAIAAAVSGKANTIHSHSPDDITQNSTHRFTTDAEKASWNAKQAALVSGTSIKTVNGESLLGSGDLTIEGSGGGSAPGNTTQAYTSTHNISFTGNNLEITGVTGNFTLTASNKTPAVPRIVVINKTTASQIVVSIDQTTLAAPSIKPLSSTIAQAGGAPPTITLNGEAGSVYIFYIVLQGAGMKPDIQPYQLGSENPINVTANYNTLDGSVFNTLTDAPANTSENVIFTVPLPANSLNPGSYLRFHYSFVARDYGGDPVNSGNVQMKIRIGPNIGSTVIVEDFGLGTTAQGWYNRIAEATVISNILMSVQKGYDIINNRQPPTTVAPNLAIDNNIYYTLEKQGASGATDNASLGKVKIEIGGQ
jgi:hypothetical protein